MKFKRHLITAALPYANGPIHVGHLAGSYLPADIYVRYLRSKKEDVLFVCGSDEHGVPITLKAKKEGITPQQVVDRYHKIMKDSFDEFGISFDTFSRTTNKVHHDTASEFFLNLYKKDVFVEKTNEQYFDEEAQQFLADRYIVGICPKCSFDSAYGDQCENCGTSLSPKDLINPTSTLSGSKPAKRQTKNWYLPLDKMQPDLEAYIEKHKDWKSNVYGQCKSWLDQQLQPRAMTRDLDWGVKVPVEGGEDKVLYVWFDAPIGYISATKELRPNDWEDYWKSKDSRLIHFIGKDNIVFHCLIFPAMLMAHGEYVLPDNVPANEFLNLEGEKLSTSRNWAVWLDEYLKEFPDKQDSLRYTLCAGAPETKDNDFTWKDFQARNNNELVAILGNFINRTVVLTHKYFDGKVPPIKEGGDTKVLGEAKNQIDKIEKALDSFRLREALSEVMNLARIGNKYLAETEPWKLIKKDKDKVAEILNNSLQLSVKLVIVMEPFLPFTSKKLAQMLKVADLNWTSLHESLSEGHVIGEATLLFEKIEDKEIEQQVEKLKLRKLEKESEAAAIVPAKESVSFEDFTKIDLRVGEVLEAEKVPKTKKLLKLKVDTGIDVRTIVSGIAEYYKPEELINKKVTVLVNLAPRKIKGIESQGMLLMAENKEGELSLVSPTKEMEGGGVIA